MARKKKGPAANYRFRCKACGLTFRAALYEGDPDPACPNLDCGVIQTAIGMDVAAGKAPGIGGSPLGRAMDTTADLVMKDFGMTDLASARMGESMAPKLPPEQQRRADAMFDPKKRAEVFGGNPLLSAAVNAMAAGGQANPSGLSDSRGIDGMSAIHNTKYKPPVRLLTSKE